MLDDQTLAPPQERPALGPAKIVDPTPSSFCCSQPLQPCQLQIGGRLLCSPGPFEFLFLASRSHWHLRGERLGPSSSQYPVTPRRGIEGETDWRVRSCGRVAHHLNLLHQVRHRFGEHEVVEDSSCSTCTGSSRGGSDLAVDRVEPAGLGQVLRLHVPVPHGDPRTVEAKSAGHLQEP